MKRLLVTVLAASIAFSPVYPVHAAPFLDVIGTPFEVSHTVLQQQGILEGFSDGRVYPHYPIKRVEALKVLLLVKGDFADRIAYYQANVPVLPLFSDVDQSQWYAAYLETGFEAGAITGYGNGTFGPADFMTVEQAITVLMRIYDQQGVADRAELSPYIENRPNEWFTPYINAAVTKNLIMPQQQMKLGTVITRGQFFDLAYRMQEVDTRQLTVFDGPGLTQPMPVAPQPVTVQPTVNSGDTGVSSADYDPDYVSPGVEQTNGTDVPPSVTVAPKIDHPYASEKYFSISMPSLGVHDLTITHPADPASKDGIMAPLELGVGHLFAYPGGGGKIMVYGHSSGYPWDVSQYTKIFRRVNELQPGDKLYVTYAGTLYVYEVTYEQTIAAKDTAPFQDNGSGEELILYTCWPPDSIAQRYLVHAAPVETIAAR